MDLDPLLESLRGRVYNLCFQVLRNRHDSEDATQEVLLKVAGKLDALRDPDRLLGWVSRIALHEALDLKRKRARRPELRRPEPAGDAAEDVAQALAALDDDPRQILVERYFEQRTLSQMARDRGCSAVAVWYRLVRAKARLKKQLVRAGLGASLAFLGAVRPAWATSFVAALAVAGGLGAMALRESTPEPTATAPRVTASTPDGTSIAPAPPEEDFTQETLTARLTRVRAWVVERHPPLAGDQRAADAYQEEYAALTSGLRELIFADPRAYVRFLKPIHEIEVLRALFFPVPRHTHRDLEDVPAPLVEGLAELLLAGSEIQREAILDGVWTSTVVPDAFVPAYDLLLGSASAEVRRLTLMALLNGGGLRERHVAPIREIVEAGRTRDLTVTALQVLAAMDDPEATRYVLGQFHTAVRPDILDGLAEFLPAVLARTRGEVDAHVDGLRRAFTLVPSRPPETPAACYGSDGYMFRRLVYITLDQLPAARAREALSGAPEVAPTPRLREGARKLLEAIDGGEARRDALVALYLRHLDVAAP